MQKEGENFWDALPETMVNQDFPEFSDKPAEKTEDKPAEKAEEKPAEKPAQEKSDDDVFDEEEDEKVDDKKDEKPDDKKDKKPGKEEEDPVVDPIQAYAEELQDAGLLIKSEKPPKNLEELLELQGETIKVTTKNTLEKWFKALPEDVTEYIKFRQTGGKKEEFFSADIIPEFDLTKVEGQEAIVRFDAKRKGLSDDDIDAMVEKAKEKDTLGDKAKIAQKAIQKAESERKERLDKEFEKKPLTQDDIVDEMKVLKKRISVVKELDGRPLADKDHLNFVNYRLKPVVNQDGEDITQFEQDLLDLEEQNPELYLKILSMVKTKGKSSSKSNRLQTALKHVKTKSETSKSWVDEL